MMQDIITKTSQIEFLSRLEIYNLKFKGLSDKLIH